MFEIVMGIDDFLIQLVKYCKEEIMEVMDVIFITSGAPAVAACRDALKLLK